MFAHPFLPYFSRLTFVGFVVIQCGKNAPQPLNPKCYDETVVCQHGAAECISNLAEVTLPPFPSPGQQHLNLLCSPLLSSQGCVVKYYGGRQYSSFLYCTEALHDGALDAMPACAAEAGIDWNEITACMNNPEEARDVTVTLAKRTAELGVSKEGTPWVMVNGKALGNNWDALLKMVCDAYLGPKPAGCSDLTPLVLHKKPGLS